MKRAAGDILGAVFLLALVMLLVRPTSFAPQFIKGFGEAMTAVLSYAVSA